MKQVAALFILILVSLNDAEARKVSIRGSSCQKNFHFKHKDCRDTFIARNSSDLSRYDQQRLMTDIDKDLVIWGDITAENLRIETNCEVKVMPHSSLVATKELILFTKELKLDAKTELKAADLYIKTDDDLKFTSGAVVNATRLLLQSNRDIEIKKPSTITSTLAILNADDCDIHKHANFNVEQKLGSCFQAAEALIKLKASPVSGNSPLPVAFDATESFGLIDQLVFYFGNNETFSTISKEVVYQYETPGTFHASVKAEGGFGTLSSAPIEITINQPPVSDISIAYSMTRVNPPQIITSVETIPNFEGGVSEYLWDFGDQSAVSIPFNLDNYGGIDLAGQNWSRSYVMIWT